VANDGENWWENAIKFPRGVDNTGKRIPRKWGGGRGPSAQNGEERRLGVSGRKETAIIAIERGNKSSNFQ